MRRLHHVRQVLVNGLRSSLLLKPRPQAFDVSPGATIALCVLNILASIGYQYIIWRETVWFFNPAGVTFEIAVFGLLLAVLCVLPFARAGASPHRIFVGITALSTVVMATAVAIAALSLILSPAYAAIVAMSAASAAFFWILLACARLGFGLAEKYRWRTGFGTLGVALLVAFSLPHASVVTSIEAERSAFSLLDIAAAYFRTNFQPTAEHNLAGLLHFDREAVLHGQHKLLSQKLAALDPPKGELPALFFVGMAPHSTENVFKREVTAVKSLFDERFSTAGRSVLLVNHRDTIGEWPLASMSNLDDTLQYIGSLMRQDRDVLVLFVSSHGSPGRVSVSFPGFPLNSMTPERLLSALDKAGIQNRVLVISACHSGSFIPPLQTDTSLIVTASRSDRSSFGCGNENEWTHFGDAYFNQVMRTGTSMIDGFSTAADLIAAWEKRDGLTPSEPQMFVGNGIREKLDALVPSTSASSLKRAEAGPRQH